MKKKYRFYTEPVIVTGDNQIEDNNIEYALKCEDIIIMKSLFKTVVNGLEEDLNAKPRFLQRAFMVKSGIKPPVNDD